MELAHIEKLAEAAAKTALHREYYYEDLIDGADSQVTYSTDDIFQAFNSYSNARAVRNHLNSLVDSGEYEFNKLANNHYALTHDQVQLLADIKGEREYDLRLKPAFVAVVSNLKGGVGKSMLTCSLADYLVLSLDHIASRKRVLIIDLDPQASVTFHYLRHAKSDEKLSAITLMSMDSSLISKELIKEESIQKSWINGIDIIPCTTEDGFIADTLYDTARQENVPVHSLLRDKVIRHIEDDYDVVLVDCGPHMDAVLKSTVGAVHGMFLPTTPKSVDFDSTLKFIERLPDMFSELIGHGYDLERLKFIKSFVNMANDNKSIKNNVYNKSAERDLGAIFREDRMQCPITNSDVYTRCSSYGRTVISMGLAAYAKHIGDRTSLLERRTEVNSWGQVTADAIMNHQARFEDL